MAIASTAKAEVGTIKVALGDVKIIGVDGVARAACVGDKVFAKEVIQTAANAIVQVQLADGRMLDLGRESSIALDDDLLGTTKAAKTASPTDDIAALQAAIAAGADPSKIAEATAAGGNTGGSGDNEGHEGIVVVGQANSSGPVTAGVETEPLLVAFEEPIPFIPLLQPILPQFFSQTLPPFSPPSQPEQLPEQPPIPDFPKVSVQLSVGQNTPPPLPPSGGAPVVKDDGDAIPEGSFVATGNVISGAGTTSGSAGADTPGTITGVTSPTGHTATGLPDGTLVIVGQYGTLTINPDGSYVYDRDPGSPDGVVEKFTYTLTDDNGVTSNADLLIDIGTPVDKPHVRTDVDVVPLGSTVTTGNVITGVGTSSGAAGADTVGSDGATITGVTGVPGSPALIGPGGVITIAGEFGTLVINPDGSYVYNANPGSEGQVDHFTYTLTDGSGDSATGNLLINIGVAPDVPLGRSDVDSIPAGGTVAAGNVITGAVTSSSSAGADTQGSDGATVTGVTSPSGNPATVGPDGVITIVGEFGTLVINPDGSYIYTLDPGAHGATDTFTYTLTDGTGDTTSAGLTINLGATPDVPLAHNDTDSIPLGGTSASGNIITGAGTVGGPDNVGSDGATVTGVSSPSGNPATIGPNGVITVVGEFGTLVINPDGSYVYTLNPGPHGATDTFTYTLTDGTGDTSSAGLTINLGTAPDVPVAHNDTDAIPPGGTSANGNVITGAGTAGGPDTVGSDGATVTGVTSPSGNPATVSPDGVITIMGEFGTLIINPDGSYIYTLNPGPHGATDTFTYTLTDGTGDSSSAGLTINLGTAPQAPPASDPSSVVLTVDGAEVLEGTYPDAKVINFVLMLDHAYSEPVQVTYQIVPGTALSPSDFFGVLTATVTIPAGQTQFIVPVSIVQDHLVEGNEVFDIVLVNAVNATIDPEANTAHITIVDDDRAPLARDDTYNIIRGQSNDLPSVFTHRDPGETLDDTGAGPYESLAIVKGPNDTLLPNGDVLIATTQGGSVVMHPDGTFTYTPPESFRGPDTFTYTMTDVVNGQPIGNGTSSAVVTLNPGDGSPSVTFGMAPGADQVNEAGLPVVGSAANSSSEKTTGTFTISDPDGVADILVVTINGQDILLAELNGRDIQTLIPDTSTPLGVMHIDSFDPLTGIVSFTYTLLTSVADTPNQPEQDLFTVSVTDNSETTSAPVTLAINIIDDTPQALNDTDSVAAGTFGPETGNVITGLGTTSGVAGIDTPGADSATLTGVTSVSGATAVKDPVTGVLTLNGLYGVLTIEPDGDDSYSRYPGTPGGVNDVFTYTLTDGDGDTVQANLDIRIGDSPVGVHVESPKVTA